MPTVPTLRSVEVRPIDPGYQSSAGATPDAFGAGIGRGLASVGQGLSHTAAVIQDISQKKRELDLAEADIEYSRRTRLLLTGDGTEANPGYYGRKGKDAVDLGAPTGQELTKIREELVAKYGTDRATQHKLNLMLSVREERHAISMAQHAGTERNSYANVLSETRQQEAKDDAIAAYNDPEITARSRSIMRDEVFSMAERNGWDPEITQSALEAANTDLYASMIRGAIQRKDHEGARNLWNTYELQMDGGVAAQLREQMNDLVFRAEAQQFQDQYAAQIRPGMDEGAFIDRVREDLKDKPEIRDEVERRLTNDLTRMNQAETRAQKAASQEALAMLTDPENPANITQVQEALGDRWRYVADDIEKLFKVERLVAEDKLFANATDNKTYINWKSKSTVRELADTDINSYAGMLTRQETTSMARDIANARRSLDLGQDAAKTVLNNAENDMFKELKNNRMFFTAKGKEKEAYALTLADLRDYVYKYVDREGKPPTDQEVKREVARLTTKLYVPQNFWPDPELIERDLTPEQRAIARIEMSTIPATTLRDLRSEISAAGKNPEDQDLVEEYAAARLLRDVGRAEKLLGLSAKPRRRGEATSPTPVPDIAPEPNIVPGDDLTNLIIRNEGRRDTVYADSLGIPTVGVGFNLHRGDARERLASVGADYDAVLAGRSRLTPRQINDLLHADIEDASKAASKLVDNFSSLSQRRRNAIIDLVFNLGPTGFSKFKNTIKAIERGDFEQAAKQLERSKWYSQVKERGPRIVNMIREG